MNENYMNRITVADAIALKDMCERSMVANGRDIEELDTLDVLAKAEKLDILDSMIECAHKHKWV